MENRNNNILLGIYLLPRIMVNKIERVEKLKIIISIIIIYAVFSQIEFLHNPVFRHVYFVIFNLSGFYISLFLFILINNKAKKELMLEIINTIILILLFNFFLCCILIAFLRYAILFYICFIVIFLIMIYLMRASDSKYEKLVSGSEKHIIVCPVCHTINESPEIGVVFHCSKCNLEMKYGHSN